VASHGSVNVEVRLQTTDYGGRLQTILKQYDISTVLLNLQQSEAAPSLRKDLLQYIRV